MARPRTPEEQQLRKQRNFRLSAADDTRLMERAAAARMSVSDFLRDLAVNGRVVVQEPAGLDFESLNTLKRLGVNLNQLTRVANAAGEIPPELERLCARIEAVFDQALDGYDF